MSAADPLLPFYEWLAQVRPDLLEAVNELPQSALRPFLLGGQVTRESIYYDGLRDKTFRRVARTLARDPYVHLEPFFTPETIARMRAEDAEKRAFEGGEVAGRIIAKLGDEPPAHTDADAPPEGTGVSDCDGECACYREGYEDGFNDAMSGDDPDDEPEVV